jgi:hypothetical protein
VGEAKFTQLLAGQLGQKAVSEVVEVVVELRAPSDIGAALPRAQRMARLKEQFEHEKAPVEQAIARAGGTVTDRAWINHSLKCRLPRGSLTQLTALPEVAAIDLPRAIEPEKL